jgi:hypothetical protein
MGLSDFFPRRVVVKVKQPSAEDLAVCLRFGMRSKNSYSYLVFLDKEGAATVSAEQLLRAFDEERQTFIMDYNDPRTAFNGSVTAKVLAEAEICDALEAYALYEGKLWFPAGYKEHLALALAKKSDPNQYEVELKLIL